MTILHGYWEFAWPKSETMFELFPNIDYHYIEIYKNGPLGHHHRWDLFICPSIRL